MVRKIILFYFILFYFSCNTNFDKSTTKSILVKHFFTQNQKVDYSSISRTSSFKNNHYKHVYHGKYHRKDSIEVINEEVFYNNEKLKFIDKEIYTLNNSKIVIIQ